MRAVQLLLSMALLACAAAPVAAQNWEFDARKIAMGGAGASGPAAKMIQARRKYRAIVLPFGLIQVLRNLDVFNPNSDEFDIVKSIEYAASPLHYIIGRDNADSDTGREFVVDVRNATLNRDLNAYRGFVPAAQPVAEGLSKPNWGGTIPVFRGDDGSVHGVYVGAGPYMSMRTTLSVDDRIIQTLGSATNVYFPNTQFDLGSEIRGQLALAVTGGYRARFASGTQGEDDGIYAAVDYHYLRGLHYEDVATGLRLSTDGAGLLTFSPLGPAPLIISRDHAGSGQGFAIDAGIGAIINGWQAGLAISGIANRINWHDVQRRRYALGDLFFGRDLFVQTPDVSVGDVRVELPVDYRVSGGYTSDAWSALAEYGHGFQGTSFRGGFEYGLGAVDLRGGGIYTRQKWQPTAGIGFNLSERVGLDVAVFGTSANVARVRRPAIATSLRINRR